MPTNSDVREQPDAERINELYWNSEQTIDEITEELGVSRNALYSAIHPQAAGISCPSCGERMVFTNRTRRDSQTGVCRSCGTEASVEERQAEEPAARFGRVKGLYSRPRWVDEVAGAANWSRWRDELSTVEPERYALVGGAAALGAVIGVAATRALRDRG